MKKFLFSVAVFALILTAFVAKAEITLDLTDEEIAEPKELTFEKSVERFIELGKHFEQTYPDMAIHTDFSEDVATQMPYLTRQQVHDYTSRIRQGVIAYRYVNGIIKKVKDAFIAPEPPPLILDDSEYDLLSPEPEFVQSDDAVVIPDFKRVVSYSGNPRDIQATRAKIGLNEDRSDLKELTNMMSQIELKKLPLYDIYQDSPLTGKKGIGDWQDIDGVRLRIITAETGVKNAPMLHGLLQFYLPTNRIIVAANSKEYFRPKISFSGTNLKDYTYTYPVPTRYIIDGKKDWPVYALNANIPVTFEAKDTTLPLEITADIEFVYCDPNLECKTAKLHPSLLLNSEPSEQSAIATFIDQATYNYLPLSLSDKIKIIDVVAEKTKADIEFLKITLESQEKISAFEIYVNNNDGIDLGYPRISIDGRKITARILPTDETVVLAGKTFEITALLNHYNALRQTFVAKPATSNFLQKELLTLSLFLLAVLGGFLLNFMPCVFPVLSIKLLALTKFGAKQTDVVRRNFRYTIIGIYSSFLAITLILALLKYVGHNIGWGMQFQNPIFLLTMIFAILVFIFDVTGLISIHTPQIVNKLAAKTDQNNLLYFLTGAFVVLMATPCTAPYLGTVVGFALAGSIVDLFIIMSGVAIGLSLPYILVFIIPTLVIFIPSPGSWMQKLSKIMLLMLFLTLGWLFSILLAQTGVWFVVRIGLYCLLFFIFTWFLGLSKEVYEENHNPENYKFNRIFFISCLVITAVISYIDAFHTNQKSDMNEPNPIRMEEIGRYIKERKTVLVAVGANWCLTCSYNNVMVFNNPSFVNRVKNKNVKIINIDWSNYNEDVLKFMEKYGRSGLPFYVLFSPIIPDGIVLPEILNESDLSKLIDNFGV